MDMSSGEWLSHLAMEDPTAEMDHFQMMMMMNPEANSNGEGLLHHIYDDPIDVFKFGNTQIVNNVDSGANQLVSELAGVKEVKSELLLDIQHPNSGGWRSSSLSSPPHKHLISFGSTECDIDDGVIGLPNKIAHETNRKKRVGGRMSNLCPQEHVLAERKRREKMTQRFSALSALIPGLTKVDKASILGDAATYLKELEQRVKLLEEQTATRTVESVILVKTTKNQNLDDGNSYLEENTNFRNCTNPLLEIEARASNKNVLVRIHSQNNQGLVQKVLNEIEKLNLATINCQTMPFGDYAMNITIIAQMNDDVGMTMKDLVLHLKQALHQQLLCRPN